MIITLGMSRRAGKTYKCQLLSIKHRAVILVPNSNIKKAIGDRYNVMSAGVYFLGRHCYQQEKNVIIDEFDIIYRNSLSHLLDIAVREEYGVNILPIRNTLILETAKYIKDRFDHNLIAVSYSTYEDN